jgi:acyl-CoA thioesterase YciA
MNNSDILEKLPDGKEPILRMKTLPNDANKSGDIFGGWLMSQIDRAGAIVAAKRADGDVVTVAVKDLVFIKPLFVYDLVSFYADVVKVGRTSITVKVEVYAERLPHKGFLKVSDATLVYVAISEPGTKRAVNDP